EAPTMEDTQATDSLTSPEREELGAETDIKPIPPDATDLGGQKMAKFVGHNHSSKGYD
ncbi:hypothetical protein HKBW3S42_01893, partial [Candidatus Hakubella thermalkaliphila]